MQKKWAEIQKNLARTISPGQLKVWVSPLMPSLDDEGLVLFAQTEFVCAHIRTWFMSDLKSAVAEVFGSDYQVRVECSFGRFLPHESPGLEADPAGLGTATAPSTSLICKEERFPVPPRTGTVCNAYPQADKAPPSPRSLPSHAQLHLPTPYRENEIHHDEQSWRFSFDDFVVGPCNRLAHAASLSMCDMSKSVDILFLSSPPGLGKTHLMQAVGKTLCGACNRTRPKVAYLTTEKFASQFIYALKSNGGDMLDFKSRYKDLDLLLLDDVHFLQGKDKTQIELLSVLKNIFERNGKIVLSSSFAPQDLKSMDEQLYSRMSAGLLSFIERPDEDTRRRILRHKASMHRIRLPEEVEDVLARPVYADVRKIESCLQTLIHKARLMNSALTPQLALELIGYYAEYCAPQDIESIITAVCKSYGFSKEQLSSGSRKQEYVCARNTAFYMARKYTDLSLEVIGRQFNRRHSTVIKGITWFEREVCRQSPLGLQLSNTVSMIEKNTRLTASNI
ncbi:MAG: ATP-binding protein [Desulfovibrio sp.]|jgi:chromosomal replication initiator protein|nr:ATP-binding protein [Desulfovibrio sp.]